MARLLDQFGNPIDTSRLAEEEAAPTIGSVRTVVTGHPADGLTPQRLGSLLAAAENGDAIAYLELAEQMEEKDLHYRSVLATRKNQVAGLEITVEAVSDKAPDVAAADLVRKVVNRPEFRLEIFDILDAIGKGFSITEMIWKTSASQWLPGRIEWRDPRWFEFDRVDGTTVLLRDAGGSKPLTPYKYIQHIHKSKSGLPIRGGLARPIAWFYLFKNFGIKSWVTFAESFGKPIRIGKFGPGASDADKKALLRAVMNLASDMAGIIPESMAVDLIEAKITGNVDMFERLAEWLDRQSSKAVLGQTGTTDVGQHVGTANAHERVRGDIEAADALQLSITLSRDVSKPVVDLNMGPQESYPFIRVYRPDQEDLKALTEHVVKLVPLGLRIEEAWIRDKLGIPDADAGAVLLSGQTTQPVAEPPQPEALAAQSQETGGNPEAPDAIDRSWQSYLDDQWENVTAPLVDPIQALADECQNYDEFLRRLPELIDAQDPQALAEALARLSFQARAAANGGGDIG